MYNQLKVGIEHQYGTDLDLAATVDINPLSINQDIAKQIDNEASLLINMLRSYN